MTTETADGSVDSATEDAMLPTFSDAVQVKVIDADDLCVVWLEEAIDGVGDNLLYQGIAEVSWEEVAEVIAAERELLAIASLAIDDEDFDRRADLAVRDRYTGERYIHDGAEIDEGPLTRFQALDLGVMSAVAALVATGCLTTTSCRGHHSGRGERRPLVRFICDDTRLPLISTAVAEARCGLHLDTWGMLQLYASDVEAFVRFASRLLARREAFASFPMENLFESRDVYGEHLENWEADHSLEYFSRRDLIQMRRHMASMKPIEGQDRLF